jgi:hypothetical protein
MPVISAPERLRQEDLNFEASLCYTVSLTPVLATQGNPNSKKAKSRHSQKIEKYLYASRPALKEILKEVFQAEMKGH